MLTLTFAMLIVRRLEQTREEIFAQFLGFVVEFRKRGEYI